MHPSTASSGFPRARGWGSGQPSGAAGHSHQPLLRSREPLTASLDNPFAATGHATARRSCAAKTCYAVGLAMVLVIVFWTTQTKLDVVSTKDGSAVVATASGEEEDWGSYLSSGLVASEDALMKATYTAKDTFMESKQRAMDALFPPPEPPAKREAISEIPPWSLLAFEPGDMVIELVRPKSTKSPTGSTAAQPAPRTRSPTAPPSEAQEAPATTELPSLDDARSHSESEDVPSVDEESNQDLDETKEPVFGAPSIFVQNPLLSITRASMSAKGLKTHVLYVYKVVTTNVLAVRTMATPIGGLESVYPNAPRGKILRSARLGELFVGVELGSAYGMWLKLAENEWVPVTRKDTAQSPYRRVMVQIRRIPIPGKKLAAYWSKPADCAEGSSSSCADEASIRLGVLRVMEKYGLIPPQERDGEEEEEAEAETEEEAAPPALEVPNADPSPSASSSSSETLVEESASAPSPKEDVLAEVETRAPLPAEAASGAVDCATLRTWARCTRHGHCMWRQMPNSEECVLDNSDFPPEDSTPLVNFRQDHLWDFKLEHGKKYFVYQPSGGWNNQRLLMENAMVICRLLNRTCIAPPAAPHSNYYYNYNKIPPQAVAAMPRVLNFARMQDMAPLRAVPQGHTFASWLQDLQENQTGYEMKVVVRDVSRYKPGTLKKWSERDFVRMFGNDPADILYFANQTMWGTIEWKGSMGGWPEKKMAMMRATMPDHMKRLAIRIAEELGDYHAVHIRRGDKVGESSFKDVSHPPIWWAERIASVAKSTKKVYVATDEKSREFFQPFHDAGMQVIFWEDLPLQKDLKEYLNAFPRRMFFDVLGMLEQLICTYANLFLGSGYSTFTTYILRLRKYRNVLASEYLDRTQEQLALGYGLPRNIRGVQSKCDPIGSLTHSVPC